MSGSSNGSNYTQHLSNYEGSEFYYPLSSDDDSLLSNNDSLLFSDDDLSSWSDRLMKYPIKIQNIINILYEVEIIDTPPDKILIEPIKSWIETKECIIENIKEHIGLLVVGDHDIDWLDEWEICL